MAILALNEWLDSMTLDVFSNQNNPVILFHGS